METTGLDKYLVDTSVWIEFFRKKEPWFGLVSGWLDEDSICCCGLIYAELLQGAKSEKEMKIIKEFKYVLEFLKDSAELWEKAGLLSYSLRKKGRTIGLADSYLAILASEFQIVMVSKDRHFNILRSEVSFSLYKV